MFKILRFLRIYDSKTFKLNKYNPLTYLLILIFSILMGIFAFFMESIDVIKDAKEELNK